MVPASCRPSRLPLLHFICAGAVLAWSNNAPPRLTGTMWSTDKPNRVLPLAYGSMGSLQRWQVQPPAGVFSLYHLRIATHLGSCNHHEFDIAQSPSISISLSFCTTVCSDTPMALSPIVTKGQSLWWVDDAAFDMGTATTYPSLLLPGILLGATGSRRTSKNISLWPKVTG